MPNQNKCEGCLHLKVVDNCNVNVFSSTIGIASCFDFCRNRNAPLVYDDAQCEYFVSNKIEVANESVDDVLIRDTISQGNNYVVKPNNSQSTSSKGMFKHIFSFEGRIRRLEYGLTCLVLDLFFLPMGLISEDDISSVFAIVWLLLLIPVLWILYAQGAKRSHDIGQSGWWQLFPYYGLLLLFEEGESGMNQYGDNPKG